VLAAPVGRQLSHCRCCCTVLHDGTTLGERKRLLGWANAALAYFWAF